MNEMDKQKLRELLLLKDSEWESFKKEVQQHYIHAVAPPAGHKYLLALTYDQWNTILSRLEATREAKKEELQAAREKAKLQAKRDYMREYMRKRRAKQKESSHERSEQGSPEVVG